MTYGEILKGTDRLASTWDDTYFVIRDNPDYNALRVSDHKLMKINLDETILASDPSYYLD